MKKKALLKTSFRETRNSPARFLSILTIIFLGVAFFVGIGATGPDMIASGHAYFKKQKLADLSVMSSLGLTDKDLSLVSETEEVQSAQGQYLLDLELADTNQVIRFFGYDEADKLNQYVVTSGKLPEKADEIALDQLAEHNGDYKLGDTFTIGSQDDLPKQLKTHEFKVVGFVNSPEYIENLTRGNTNVGSGGIDYFAVVPYDQFDMDVYSRILVAFKKDKTETTYSDAYEKRVKKGQKALEKVLQDRPQERINEVRAAAQEQLDKATAEIAAGEKALDDGASQLDDAYQQITAGKAELATKRQELNDQIAAGKTALDQGEAELNQQAQALEDQKKTLASGQEQLEQAKKQAEELKEQTKDMDKLKTSVKDLESLQKALNDLTGSLKAVAESNDLAQAIGASTAAWQTASESLPDESLKQALQSLTPESTKEEVSAVASASEKAAKDTESQKNELQQQLTELEKAQEQLSPEALAAQEEQLKAAQEQLDQGEAAIASGRQEIADKRNALTSQEQAGNDALDAAEAELADKEALYHENVDKYQEETSKNMPKLLDAQQQLENQKRQLAELEPEDYIFSDRNDNPGYTEFKQNADRISSLATVFPIIFFLIAALVSLTTMSRMVEEKRGEIGTFRALGYKNREIAVKFLLYAAIAGILGSVAGLALGFYLFPSIIINAYGALYNFSDFTTPWYVSYSVIGVLVALLCTVGITFVTLRIDLFSTPAALLRPKAPKSGKRVWLERIKPLWSRLSFIRKVTVRNLFRYKSRMFMTIFGIAGCTSMIVTGFGLRDSIGDMVPLQFEKLWRYQAVVTFEDGITDENRTAYHEALDELEHFNKSLGVASDTLTMSSKGQTTQDVSVYLPETTENLGDFVLFNNRKTGEVYQLTDEGAIIDEKLADLFHVKPGDTITLTSADKEDFQLKVAHIAENYTGHFAYLSKNYYQEVFQKEPSFNSEFLRFDQNLTKAEEKAVTTTLMEQNQVINVSFLSAASNELKDTMGILTIVVWVLIISAGLLAFIVLYNLNNINISERIRELSTIKVLGFYDNEVTMYIYRENIFLTIVGIIGGLVLGYFEHLYVLTTVELDILMFSPALHWQSYGYASLITIFFALVVGIVIYFKLKKIDMIEALKLNE
ncbi:ABC transporter permease [Enterococcus asini]|uniref:FtsX-like permease family protein n=1 Tax=Enterococcus asini TaxID=57732 RepID=UPI002891C068|nr:FtsX-like permease family protein [Enterococcus asini]MDT2764542.1 ABC transporter permease [Enterococcus asini]